jgi:GT2 family glycosyltransferase
LNEDRIEQLELELVRLREENATVLRTLDAMNFMMVRRLAQENILQRHMNGRLDHVEHIARDTARIVRELMTSRIWRALSTVGWVMMHAVPKIKMRKHGLAALTEAERQERIQMRCDSINTQSADPVAGQIEITGWAIAPDGIERVEVRVGNLPELRVSYGSPRPDIEALFPQMKNPGKSGFAAGLDTRDLPNGVHRLKLKAFSRKGQERELDLPLVVNQEIGILAEYTRWIQIFEQRDNDLVQVQLAGLKYRPTVSVVVPVYRTTLDILSKTIASVKNQSYINWQLCLADDCSEMPELTAMLELEAAEDPRIRIAHRTTRGGISAASNDALQLATGEYVALLDHDDMLTLDALFHLVKELQGPNPPELLYSDEDHIDESGRRFAPFFKPDWSPDTILSENYVTHLMMFSRKLALSIGGFRSEFDLSQDHDILLRLSEKANKIVHVPKVLYHWRTSIASMSRASASHADRAIDSSRRVVASFVKGRATVEPGLHEGRWRVRYPIPARTRVTILIPTAGKMEVLERNLKALWETAGYQNYEILIIDNSKGGDAVLKFVDDLKKKGKPIRWFDQRGEPFNYSRLNNKAVATCNTELLLFLNDDTEGISVGWLEALVEHAMRPEVGAVGAKLLYPNGTIQHAGVTMGLAQICGHSFKGLEARHRHYFDFPDLVRNVSSLTAACVMVRADVFREVGGFDEELFPIAYNDIDFVLRIGAAGYRVIYNPHAQLHHHEAYSKTEAELTPHAAETNALKTKWKNVIQRDPFYNPNLTRHHENWGLRWD